MNNIKKASHDILEWLFPAIIICGACLTAYDVYPLNKWVFIVGNGGLAIMCVVWKRWSLVALNTILASIYILGLIVR